MALPSDHTKEEFENVITIVITAWNAVVMDGWESGNRFEAQLLSSLQSAPKVIRVEMKRLIKRKKTKFGSDPRGVGNHWVRVKDGEFVFGCEARLNVENAPVTGATH